MPFTEYFDQSLMQLVWMGVAWTPPATVYAAPFLTTTQPTQLKGATTPYWAFTEPTDTAYARQGLPTNSFNFAASGTQPANGAGYSVTTLTTITFPVAGVTWGQVDGLGFFDSLTGGNLMGFGYFGGAHNADPQQINAAGQLVVPAGVVVVTNN